MKNVLSLAALVAASLGLAACEAETPVTPAPVEEVDTTLEPERDDCETAPGGEIVECR